MESNRYSARGGWVIIHSVARDTGNLVLLDESDRYEGYAEVVSVGNGTYQAGKLVAPRAQKGDMVIIKGGPRVLHPIPGDPTHAAVWHEDIICTVDPTVPVEERPRIEAVSAIALPH